MCSNLEVLFKELYFMFICIFVIDIKFILSLLFFFNYYYWKRVVIIYENVIKWIEIKNNMVKWLRVKGIIVVLELLIYFLVYYRFKNYIDNYRGIMRKIKEEVWSKCIEKDFVYLVKYEGYIKSNYLLFDFVFKKF